MTQPQTPPPVFSLWIEGPLGRLERMCLASFVASGHPVALYSYGAVTGLPDGVEPRDAREVLPEAIRGRIGEGRGRNAALADIFRYHALAAGAGIWVDCDIACLRPLPAPGPFLAGLESPGRINNAVLHLAPDHPLLAEAIDWVRPGRIPFWLRPRKRAELLVRRLAGRPMPPARLPWGALGPQLVTALAARAGLTGAALPSDRFYPLPWTAAKAAFDGSVRLEAVATEATLAIHLWNDRVREVKTRPPVPGSIFDTLCRRFSPD